LRHRPSRKILFVAGLWGVLAWSILPLTAGVRTDGAKLIRPAPPQTADGGAGEGQVDLNRATVEELLALPSIGPVLAKRIVDYRRRHGRFRRPEEVIIVSGMSASRYRRIAHRLIAGPVAVDVPEGRSGVNPARSPARQAGGGRNR
jgi:competence ComEA-like helix-hairpin-helix protein